MNAAYDYVIVGGGSAGCVLAARLTEDPSTHVLVLEAGRRDSWWDLYIHMPAALSFPIGRRIYHARGKVLGGSSSINGMIFQRGNPLDYERWKNEAGLDEWDYAHCLPYFKRMETCLARAGERPAVRRVLRRRPGGGIPAHRRRQRLPAGGLRAVRPDDQQRPPVVGCTRLPASGSPQAEPRAAHARARRADRLRGHARGRRPGRR